MQTEPLTHDRVTINTDPQQLEILISAKKRVFLVGFLIFWLCMWGIGEVSVITALLTGGGNSAFLLFWLCGWTLGGVLAASALLWLLGGQERITVAFGQLLIERRMFGLRRSRRFHLNAVKNLRYVEAPTMTFGKKNRSHPSFISSFREGSLRFDHGMNTIAFGLELDEAAVKHMIAWVEAYQADQMRSVAEGGQMSEVLRS